MDLKTSMPNEFRDDFIIIHESKLASIDVIELN